MKKVILASLSVLSLSLFSFTLPGEANGVIQTDDGNYTVAKDAKFTPADQQTLAGLVQKLYNIDESVQNQPVTMLKASGSYEIFSWLAYKDAVNTGVWRGTDIFNQLIRGTDTERAVSLIDRYAKMP